MQGNDCVALWPFPINVLLEIKSMFLLYALSSKLYQELEKALWWFRMSMCNDYDLMSFSKDYVSYPSLFYFALIRIFLLALDAKNTSPFTYHRLSKVS